ncbi:hypothetical protein IMG5_168460 [Ichthyophthirius multifiliis]|uniref:Transmembrane protein n=1 Tax=Ichthyophthirius multifiliis TaxID=5932 RepID=G0R143_ICHMU|nr:hypothetical protein IMG5_168460 [Ichthyophthirius multifiliis]EGR28810.1 hypothetical protein IMG5_168460 [Ichthyophthirius multifiliis]|eukprot:XP_004030046.1 hypothetical protein IMG5_168460 [Ichthyophthirius multifiliis]
MNLRNIKLEDYSEEVKKAYSFPDKSTIDQFKCRVNMYQHQQLTQQFTLKFVAITLSFGIAAHVYITNNLGGKVIKDRIFSQQNMMKKFYIKSTPFLGLAFAFFHSRQLLENPKLEYLE